MKKSKKIIYLDHAATTPLDREVEKAMQSFWCENFGNPSSSYSLGVKAKQALETARANIAKVLNAKSEEIIFTAGGTESINLAILGTVRKFPKGSHIITSQIEHHCVLESFKALEKEGYKATYLPVDSDGLLSLQALQNALTSKTVFVSIMYANNEIGTVEPLEEIGRLINLENKKRREKKQNEIVFHSDACQATGYLNLNVATLGVDLFSLNASKIYGPKQVGVLYVKQGLTLTQVIFGGGQENNLRSGTENVPGIVGFSKALDLVSKYKSKEENRLEVLRNYFFERITKEIPNTFLNGCSVKNKSLKRLPNNVNILFKGVEGEALVLYLDSYGICASTGSACVSQLGEASHVLLAIGRNTVEAQSSVRFTLGKSTNKKDLDYAVQVLKSLVKMLREVKKL